MKIDMMPEVSEQSVVVENSLTIELHQIGNDHLEVRLVPHYENRVFFTVKDSKGNSRLIHLPEANQVILNYILEGKIGTV